MESVCRDDRKMKKERIQRFEISNEDTLYSFNSMSEDLSSKEHCIAGSGSILSYVLSEDGTRPSEEKIIIYVRKRRLHTHTHTRARLRREERVLFFPDIVSFLPDYASSYRHLTYIFLRSVITRTLRYEKNRPEKEVKEEREEKEERELPTRKPRSRDLPERDFRYVRI